MNKDGFTSFLVGLGVGVGIGLLFAPKSGAETRTLIKSKADESREYLRESANDLIEKGKEMVGRQKDNLAEAVQAGKQAYREAVGQQPPQPPAGSPIGS